MGVLHSICRKQSQQKTNTSLGEWSCKPLALPSLRDTSSKKYSSLLFSLRMSWSAAESHVCKSTAGRRLKLTYLGQCVGTREREGAEVAHELVSGSSVHKHAHESQWHGLHTWMLKDLRSLPGYFVFSRSSSFCRSTYLPCKVCSAI